TNDTLEDLTLRRHRTREQIAKIGRQHVAEAKPAGDEYAIIQRGREVKSIARSGHRNIQQPLDLFTLAGSCVFVGLGSEIANRDDWRTLACTRCGGRTFRSARGKPD